MPYTCGTIVKAPRHARMLKSPRKLLHQNVEPLTDRSSAHRQEAPPLFTKSHSCNLHLCWNAAQLPVLGVTKYSVCTARGLWRKCYWDVEGGGGGYTWLSFVIAWWHQPWPFISIFNITCMCFIVIINDSKMSTVRGWKFSYTLTFLIFVILSLSLSFYFF